MTSLTTSICPASRVCSVLPNNLGNNLNNLAAEFKAWIPFTTAGFYRMGVNSDDGFRVCSRLGSDSRQVNVRDRNWNRYGRCCYRPAGDTLYGNGGFGATLPVGAQSLLGVVL